MSTNLISYKSHLGVQHSVSPEVAEAYNRTVALAIDRASKILGGSNPGASIDWSSPSSFMVLSNQLTSLCWQTSPADSSDGSGVTLVTPNTNQRELPAELANSWGTIVVPESEQNSPDASVLRQIIQGLQQVSSAAPYIPLLRDWWGRLGQFSLTESTNLSVGSVRMIGDIPTFALKCSNLSATLSTGSGCNPVPSGSYGYYYSSTIFRMNMTTWSVRKKEIIAASNGAIQNGVRTAPM